MKCPECKGTGKYKGYVQCNCHGACECGDCNTCRGTGKVKDLPKFEFTPRELLAGIAWLTHECTRSRVNYDLAFEDADAFLAECERRSKND